MSLAPSVAVPRAAFNPLPIYIGIFCLLWSFSFVAGKIAVTDCPPLILLAARFLARQVSLILGISALRRGAGRCPGAMLRLTPSSAWPITRCISASAILGLQHHLRRSRWRWSSAQTRCLRLCSQRCC